MTNEPAVHPAEERLLDAALAQLFAGEQRQRVQTAAPWSRWLAAALLLLGVAVTTAVMWLARTDRGNTAQEPETAPLPAEMTGEGKTELEALPVTTLNLVAKLVDPTDLPVVARFDGLRRLQLNAQNIHIAGISTGRFHPGWSKPAADLLVSVAKLPHLETLLLSHNLAVTPALLAPLAGHATLRKLEFVGDSITIDAAFADALAAIPHLRSLHLMFVSIDGDALRHLARLPLMSLELEWCSGLDAAGWQSLLSMQNLQHLSFKDWAWNTKKVEAGTPLPWRPAAEDVRRLAELPALRSLELLHCQLEDEQLAALPDTLSELWVFGTKLTPAGFAGLRRLGGLRKLDLDASLRGDSLAAVFAPDSAPAAEVVAEALLTLHLQSLRYTGALSLALAQAIGAQSDLRDLSIRSKEPDTPAAVAMLSRLPLQRFSWNGPITPELLQAIAAQPRLQELELSSDDITLLAPLAASPTLQRLVLNETSTGNGIEAAVLTPLAGCGALQELEVRAFVARGNPHPTQNDLQRAVGDRIRLQLHETELTVKR